MDDRNPVSFGGMSFLTVSAIRPDRTALERALTRQRALPVTFDGPLQPTAGFRFVRVLEPLGTGENVLGQAARGLEAWAVYPGWMTLYPYPAPVEKGVCAAFVTGVTPFWAVSAVRITEVERSAGRSAFTLRTLPQHPLAGAERFCVYRDEQDAVWYELTALSKPQHPLAKLGAPAVRLVQRRFARDSVRSLRGFIRTGSNLTRV